MDETSPARDLAHDAAEAAQNISTISDYEKVREALMTDSSEAQFSDVDLPIGPEPIPVDAVEPHIAADTPAEEAVGAAPEEAKDASSDTPPDPPRRPRTGKVKTAKARIDKVVWEREEARKEATHLREQLASLQAQPAPDHTTTPQAPAVPSTDANDPNAEPMEGSYEEYGAFVAAKARWAARQEVSEAFHTAQQQQLHAAQQQRDQSRANAFAEKMANGSNSDPEFLATIQPEILNLRPAMSLAKGEEPTGATAIADVLLESETPQKLMSYLSSNEEDFRRISALHPMLAMREIGRIEVGLDAVPNGPASAPVSSQAQPPIRPVGSSSASSPAANRDPSEINSVAEWDIAREQLLHQR
jgi:hypothetical protein